MINSIVATLLKDKSRVTVPGIGTFIKNEHSEIFFSPLLKGEDDAIAGRLEAYLTPEESRAAVAEYARAVKEVIAAKGVFYIDSVGFLSLDINGMLAFSVAVPKLEAVSVVAEVAPAAVAIESAVTVEAVVVPEGVITDAVVVEESSVAETLPKEKVVVQEQAPVVLEQDLAVSESTVVEETTVQVPTAVVQEKVVDVAETTAVESDEKSRVVEAVVVEGDTPNVVAETASAANHVPKTVVETPSKTISDLVYPDKLSRTLADVIAGEDQSKRIADSEHRTVANELFSVPQTLNSRFTKEDDVIAEQVVEKPKAPEVEIVKEPDVADVDKSVVSQCADSQKAPVATSDPVENKVDLSDVLNDFASVKQRKGRLDALYQTLSDDKPIERPAVTSPVDTQPTAAKQEEPVVPPTAAKVVIPTPKPDPVIQAPTPAAAQAKQSIPTPQPAPKKPDMVIILAIVAISLAVLVSVYYFMIRSV